MSDNRKTFTVEIDVMEGFLPEWIYKSHMENKYINDIHVRAIMNGELDDIIADETLKIKSIDED